MIDLKDEPSHHVAEAIKAIVQRHKSRKALDDHNDETDANVDRVVFDETDLADDTVAREPPAPATLREAVDELNIKLAKGAYERRPASRQVNRTPYNYSAVVLRVFLLVFVFVIHSFL